MPYRILSLDGGGVWALIEIKALIALYGKSAHGETVLDDFDLVAANSGGSIVLGQLLEDRKLVDILGLFENEKQRRSIFSPSRSLTGTLLHSITGVGPQYSTEDKLKGLRQMMPNKGDIPLKEVAARVRRPAGRKRLHLLIAGFDYDFNRAVFFRSSRVGGPAWGKGEASHATLAQAIHASTNAPVNYFDAPAEISGAPPRSPACRYWDGAIAGCNNPVLAAVTEAIVKGQRPANIETLSIGTGSVVRPRQEPGMPPSPYTQPATNPGIITDIEKLARAIMDDPPDVATFLACVMTGMGKSAGRVVRMNPLISPVKGPDNKTWKAPGTMTLAEFNLLADIDIDAVEGWQVEAISEYTNLWLRNIAPNQPIRMDPATLEPELGQATFGEAAAAWDAIKRGRMRVVA